MAESAEPQHGTARYVVVKITERQQRDLIYRAGTEITVTEADVLADLAPKDLRALNLWDEADALARTLDQPPQRCHAHYGKGGDLGAGTCLRAAGHPPVSDDGIGHSDSVRHQGL